MYSPSLVTYTFYRDLESFNARKEKIIRSEISSHLNNGNILNLSRSINAFNFTFGGATTSVPLCSSNELYIVDELLHLNVIDAYCAGKKVKENEVDWFYKGNPLALILILSSKFGVKIYEDDLKTTLDSICFNEIKDARNFAEGFEKSGIIEILVDLVPEHPLAINLRRAMNKKGFFKTLFGI